jgi:hypothetical protein
MYGVFYVCHVMERYMHPICTIKQETRHSGES